MPALNVSLKGIIISIDSPLKLLGNISKFDNHSFIFMHINHQLGDQTLLEYQQSS